MDFRRGAGGLRRMRGRSGQGRGGRRRAPRPLAEFAGIIGPSACCGASPTGTPCA
jgi:hypothetical protein